MLPNPVFIGLLWACGLSAPVWAALLWWLL